MKTIKYKLVKKGTGTPTGKKLKLVPKKPRPPKGRGNKYA